MSRENIPYWDELTADQIYVEIIKSFACLKDSTGGSMYDIFGEEWELLDRQERKIAEERFRLDIRDRVIRGIIFDHLGGGELRENQYGEVVYKRIPDDDYRRRQ